MIPTVLVLDSLYGYARLPVYNSSTLTWLIGSFKGCELILLPRSFSVFHSPRGFTGCGDTDHHNNLAILIARGFSEHLSRLRVYKNPNETTQKNTDLTATVSSNPGIRGHCCSLGCIWMIYNRVLQSQKWRTLLHFTCNLENMLC